MDVWCPTCSFDSNRDTVSTLGQVWSAIEWMFNGSMYYRPPADYIMPSSWSLPVEYVNSNFIYAISFIVIEFESNGRNPLVIYVATFFWTLFNHQWAAHFIVGLGFGHLSRSGLFKRYQKWDWSLPANCVLIITAFLCYIRSNYSIGSMIYSTIRQFQHFDVDANIPEKILQSRYTPFEENPNILIFCSIWLWVIETTPFLRKLLQVYPLLFLGRISFVLYLVHHYWIHSANVFVAYLLTGPVSYEAGNFPAMDTLAFWSTLPLFLLFCEGLTRLVDVPAIQFSSFVVESMMGKKPRDDGSPCYELVCSEKCNVLPVFSESIE